MISLQPTCERQINKSCLNSFWNVSLGGVFKVMVSVIAVKSQFSSPSIVLLSTKCPGIFSRCSNLVNDK